MYDSVRQQALDRAGWKSYGGDALSLQFLEAWRYDNDTSASKENFFIGSMTSETELHRWLSRTAPSKQPSSGRILGSIKLLVCDRTQYTPLDFSLSRCAFEKIESVFELSPLTVPSLESEAGTHSRFVVQRDDDSSKLRRIHVLLKAPQKREILNWGLSLSHDVATGATTGFLYGSGLGSLTTNHNYDLQESTVRSPIGPFVRSIQAAFKGWDHPMLLPCLFLSEHLSCINIFCTQGKVMSETVNIEHQLGVTKVGQSAYLKREAKAGTHSQQHVQPMGVPNQPAGGSPRMLSREETEALTVRINTQSTRVAFTARSPEWNLACARFILNTMAEIKPYLADCHIQSQHDCKQLLEHNITLAEAAASNIAVIKERMALQLDVLYSFIAQLDNQTSAELAASASRDSTSMKILAFISALFLPGSFVSAMFSIDMFDWEASRGDAVLSSRFWIYWAVALPLTAITVLGWAAWWYFELGRFNQKITSIRDRPAAKSTTKQSA